MKHIIRIITVILALGTLLGAKEPQATHTYEGEVAGVVCSACSAKVKAALGKLPGVSSVVITASDKPGTAKLKVVSTSDGLTKDAAIKSLGTDANHYLITKFAPAKDS